MKNGGGHFAPELGGHFELESGGHFKLELGGQYHWNLQSGINNLIIALFDNDAAALKEINNLKKVKLPNNIKVLQYPDIELAKNYPTIGPTGNQHMDVNGLACSIEMYLGIDCITENNEFLKIQWTGLVENIDKYQGVILKKEEVQKRFRQKVKNFNPNLIELDNWKELHLIINMMNNCWKT